MVAAGSVELVRGHEQEQSIVDGEMTVYYDGSCPLCSAEIARYGSDTEMNCLKQAIADTHRAYSHHIQRLMVTGNFALLLGVKSDEISNWYLAVYADAFEWAELPNTVGMSQFADSVLLASKPYAASGAYIDRMSDFCKQCSYDVRQKSGSDAFPFNYLYWAFLIRNRKRLQDNPRLTMAYRQL